LQSSIIVKRISKLGAIYNFIQSRALSVLLRRITIKQELIEV